MTSTMTTKEAMTLVKKSGYSVILGLDRRFYVDPPEGLDEIAEVLPMLKDEMLSALALMDRIIAWADNDRKKWGKLLALVKQDWKATLEDTPWGTLIDWTGNRMSYSRGLHFAHPEDISFYSRVVESIERKVPEALVQEKTVATRLAKRVAAA